MMPAGCGFCDCCDPWPISWFAVPEATHYVVRWKCSINPEQVHDVGNKTAIADVCNDIDMCNGMCAFTVGYIKVQACNDDGCSALVNIPADQSPITCGGGCCCCCREDERIALARATGPRAGGVVTPLDHRRQGGHQFVASCPLATPESPWRSR